MDRGRGDVKGEVGCAGMQTGCPPNRHGRSRQTFGWEGKGMGVGQRSFDFPSPSTFTEAF